MRQLAMMILMLACQSEPVVSPSEGRALGLSTGRVAQTARVGLAPADANSLFITVELTLENQTAEPTPLAAALFRMATEGGLEVYGDPATSFHPRGCQQTAAVSPGATVSCVVVFRSAASTVPSRLTYQRADGRTASAPLTPLIACTSCDGQCLDLHGDDPNNCGGCGVTVGLGTCQDGLPICRAGASLCDGACVDLESDPENCGSCGKSADFNIACEGGEFVCRDTSQQNCDSRCVSLYDQDNCGECGRRCGDGVCGLTEDGGFACRNQTTDRVSCDTLCGSLTCTRSDAQYLCAGYYYLHGCGITPPETTVNPSTGETCTFSMIFSDCE